MTPTPAATNNRSLLAGVGMAMLTIFAAAVLTIVLVPNCYGVQQPEQKMEFLLQLFSLEVLMPGIGLFLAYKLDIVDDENTKYNVVISLMILSTFYFWLFLNMKGISTIFLPIKILSLGSVLALFLGITLSLLDTYDLFSTFVGLTASFLVMVVTQSIEPYHFEGHYLDINRSEAYGLAGSYLSVLLAAYGLYARRHQLGIREAGKGILVGGFCFFVSLIIMS